MRNHTQSGRARRLAALGIAALFAGCSADPNGILVLRLVNADSGEPTPGRIEVLDERGGAHVALDALPLTLECEVAPLPGWASWLTRSDHIENPHSGTTQFYSDGSAELSLPPGRYRITVYKGIEYRVARRSVQIHPLDTAELSVSLNRWIDLPRAGWYSADDHLHISRLTAEDDRRVATWMQAEDLHVANLLQMGTASQFGVTPQRAFGAAGEHRQGDTLLISGQEHPRTHLLGHTITLGARAPIDLRETYIVFDRFWRESRRLGGVSGFAHWGLGPARDGLAVDAPGGLLSFVEVLQFEYPHYDVWYELLDLGVPLTPTAGTDFPCGPWSIPGRERFYTRLDGPLDRERWLEGVRRGRTFVTNGPLLELTVGGAGIGDTLRLDRPGPVRVIGVVRFDRGRDHVTRVELIRNGLPVASRTPDTSTGSIRLVASVQVEGPAWFALRVEGDKVGETPLEPMGLPGWLMDLGRNVASGASIEEREAFAAARATRVSAAHTAPIYVSVAGQPPLGWQPGAADRAREWLARLDALEAKLADDRIGDFTIWDWVPYSDGVSEEHLRRNRAALLAVIAESREFYQRRLGDPPTDE